MRCNAVITTQIHPPCLTQAVANRQGSWEAVVICDCVCVLHDADFYPPSSRHRDKDAEFVTLCKSLHVTDLVCDRAWTLWKTVQESMDEVAVCIYVAM